MYINIKISEKAKENIDNLKEDNKFSTFSECINEISRFFKTNNLSPRDIIAVNEKQTLFENHYALLNEFKILKELFKVDFIELKKFIKEDSQSLRKRHGALERDSFIPMGRKIDSIYKKLIDDGIDERNEKLEKKLINDDDKVIDYSDALKKNNELLESRNKTINELQTIVDKQDITMNEYFQTLKKLNDSIKYEKTLTGNKIFINLSLEEVNDLFKLIP